MSLEFARRSYGRAAQAGLTAPEDPHAIIGVALTELHGALEALSHAVAAGDHLPPSPMTRALSAIYLLQNSLDFERGGDIAPALFQVYEYCRVQVVAAFRREIEDPEGIAKALSFIASLRGAWSQIGQQPSGAIG
ncbi:flagellar export chaperone FliS [Paracoccus sp. (in: a-proteobacteria)]|uniref:flagellar export chaperone FliS n=1 Tax=Paracoccus sp. TaxID=267 RepID=UPI00272B63A7|nr:flagellar protein FliS [Paracoccus sp. (in: a-proteobacteria)]